MTHLNATAKAAIRASIKQQREGLLERIRGNLSESEQNHFADILGQSSGDSSDEALATSLVDLAAARIDNEIGQLRALDRASQRLESPDFGICEQCGSAIPVARLVAYPGAVRCVACQAEYERTHAGLAHGSL